MRSIVGAVVVIAALAGTSTGEDIYRWKDANGGVHYANAPSPGAPPAPTQSEGSPSSDPVEPSALAAPVEETEGGATADAAPKRLAPDEVPGYSTDVSIRRSALERELRGTQSRLKEIDGRLATLERARMRNAGGSAATGGVGAPAADVLSPEEETLMEEREEITAHAADVRTDAANLKQEVEGRLGTVPEWWTDLR